MPYRGCTSCCQGCVQFSFKLANILLGLVGISLIAYSLWMLEIFHEQHDDKLSEEGESDVNGDDDDYYSLSGQHGVYASEWPSAVAVPWNDIAVPWPVMLTAGTGTFILLTSLVGLACARGGGGVRAFGLSLYIVCVLALMLIEATLVLLGRFDPDLFKRLPEDPTGSLDKARAFMRDKYDFCKYVGAGVLGLQTACLVLAMAVHAFFPGTTLDAGDSYDDLPDDSPFPRRRPHLGGYRRGESMPPLSRPAFPGPARLAMGVPVPLGRSDWTARMRERYGLDPGHLGQVEGRTSRNIGAFGARVESNGYTRLEGTPHGNGSHPDKTCRIM
eukprot:jgi/Mesvir1/16970/Mv15817-RA.1